MNQQETGAFIIWLLLVVVVVVVLDGGLVAAAVMALAGALMAVVAIRSRRVSRSWRTDGRSVRRGRLPDARRGDQGWAQDQRGAPPGL